jgi:hypothetical protein
MGIITEDEESYSKSQCGAQRIADPANLFGCFVRFSAI